MENITVLTKEVYKKFIRRHSKKSFIVIRICYAMLFLSSFFYLFSNAVKNYGSFVFTLICALLFMLYDIFYVNINLFLLKNKNILNLRYNYIFTENNINIQVTNEIDNKQISSESFDYSIIYKVKDYDDCFYIYINRVNAYPVKKDGFKNESECEKTLEKLKSYVNKK